MKDAHIVKGFTLQRNLYSIKIPLPPLSIQEEIVKHPSLDIHGVSA